MCIQPSLADKRNDRQHNMWVVKTKAVPRTYSLVTGKKTNYQEDVRGSAKNESWLQHHIDQCKIYEKMCQRKRLTCGGGKHEPAWVTFHIWFVKLLYCPLRHCKRKKWRWRLWYVWVILFCWVPLSVWVLRTVKQYALYVCTSLCVCERVCM